VNTDILPCEAPKLRLCETPLDIYPKLSPHTSVLFNLHEGIPKDLHNDMKETN